MNKNQNKAWDSVPKKLERSTLLALERATGLISHKGKKRLTRSSNWCTISGSKEPQKIHLQVRGHACCLVFHVMSTAFCHLSKIEKGGCYRGDQAMQYSEKTVKPITAAICLTYRQRQVKPEKRPAVSLYLNELLIKYVNSEVDRSSVSHHGFPPGGSMAPCRSHHG